MTAFVVRSSDLERCPIRSLRPAHYRPDGSCLCTPPCGHAECMDADGHSDGCLHDAAEAGIE